MHPRLFRLIEALQRIDDRLRSAQVRADGLEVDRLLHLKHKAKQLIARFLTAPAIARPYAPAH